jgi:phenylalanyl-tRNA synthetase beta subunit
MKFSLQWLQEYSKEKLPDIKKLEEIVTFNAFEIEEVGAVGNDFVLDIKVLPNRAHDALGHRGMARDMTALVGNTFVDPAAYYDGAADANVSVPAVITEDPKACTRFISVRIDGVSVTESPEWLKLRLNAIGQKSINSIVDITNYVQFSLNKPMHAYDASLIAGNTLTARFAKAGEKLTTLDDKELELDEATLVIADLEKPLGLAGIKGGKFSGISSTTTSIILESANFNPTLIRKTSQKYGIRTDASKRFENEISDELVEEGLRMTIALVQKLNPQAKVGEVVDVRNTKPWQYTVSVSTREVNKVLGTSYTDSEVKDVFTKLGFTTRVSSARNVMEEKMMEAKDATYKNPSSMRTDAPHSFSCSSLMSFVFSGIWQPSISIDKYAYGEKVTEPKWGDLVFSNTGEVTVHGIRYMTVDFLPGTSVKEGIDHVGIYVGDNKVVHVSHNSINTTIEDIDQSKDFKNGVMYARMVDVDEERFFVSVPYDRLDIRIKEDLIEEVARVKGLSSIKGVLPKIDRIGVPHKRLYYENKVKNILHEQGFSEIMTYSFGETGEVEIVKGLATDKTKLRSSLAPGMGKAFEMNMLHAPLLNIQAVKIYEFGNVFTKSTERKHLALVIDDGKKKSSFTEEVDMILSQIKRDLSVSLIEYETVQQKPYTIELDFDTLIESLPEPISYEPLSQDQTPIAYAAVSPYPFIVRDIAVWVPVSASWEDIHALALQIDSPYIARIDCFDTFSKEIDGIKKTSFAFRFVLQSHERTLTDTEANEVADRMYTLLKEKGYEIR